MIRTRNLLIWSQTRYRCATESLVSQIDIFMDYEFDKQIANSGESNLLGSITSMFLLSSYRMKKEAPFGPTVRGHFFSFTLEVFLVTAWGHWSLYYKKADVGITACSHVGFSRGKIDRIMFWFPPFSIIPSTSNIILWLAAIVMRYCNQDCRFVLILFWFCTDNI